MFSPLKRTPSVFKALLLFMLFTLILYSGSPVGRASAEGVCDTPADVSVAECQALEALYNSTGGATSWTTSTNWLVTSEVCTWYGITCDAGSVTSIDLNSNNLTGTIPSDLGSLTQLQVLSLFSNHLSGSVPASLGSLSNLTYLGLLGNMLSGEIPAELGSLTGLTSFYVDYNSLTATDPALVSLLDTLDPSWSNFQTLAPSDLSVSNEEATSLTLNWTPINYKGDGGYYEIQYSTTPGGPYTVHGQTSSKTDSSYTVTGLSAEQTYYFVVRTFTPAPPFSQQPNDVWSDLSGEASGTTLAVTTGTLTGTVRDPANATLEGVNVQIQNTTHNTIANTSTGPAGVYNIELDPGTYYVMIEHHPYAKEWWPGSVGTPVSAQMVTITVGNTSIADMTLDTGGTVRGTVYGTGNVPLEGVMLNLEGAWIGACTDANGQFTFNAVPLNMAISVRADTQNASDWCAGLHPEYLREWWNNQSNQNDADYFTLSAVDSDHEGTDFYLELGELIEGYVYQNDGATPIEGAHVGFEPYPDGGDWFNAQTDEFGHYTVYVAPGLYRSMAEAPGFAYEVWEEAGYRRDDADPIDPATAGLINFTLDPGGEISGRVTDGGGNGVPNMNIGTSLWHGRCTDADGYFTLESVPFDVTVQLRVGGQYNWCGGDTTYAMEFAYVTLNSGHTSEIVNFEVEEGGTISGIVTDNDLNPLGGMEVRIDDLPYDGRNMCTNPDGTFYFEGLPYDTPFVLRVIGPSHCGGPEGYIPEYWNDKSNYGDATRIRIDRADPHRDGFAIALEDGLIVSGHVLIEGTTTPINNAHVALEHTNTGHWYDGSSNAEGYYSITVPLGSYRARADANGYALEVYNQQGVARGQANILNITADQPGIDFTLAPGGTISGRVVDSTTEQGLNQINVNFWNDDIWLGACTDNNGYYTINHLPLDGRDLIVQAASGNNWCTGQANLYVPEYYPGANTPDGGVAIHLTELDPTESNVNFTLAMGNIVTGVVTQEANPGTPIPNAWLQFDWFEDGNYYTNVQTDANGNFTVGLPEGAFRVRTDAPGFAFEFWDNKGQNGDQQNVDPLNVPEDTTTGLAIELAPGGSISGYVRDAQGNALPNMPVWPEGLWQGTCTDPNGYYTLDGLALNVPIMVGAGGNNWCGGSPLYLNASVSGGTLTMERRHPTDVDITLEVGNLLTIHVVGPDDQPIPYANLNYQAWFGDHWEGIGGDQTDQNGTRIGTFMDGSYNVLAWADGYAQTFYRADGQQTNSPDDATQIDLTDQNAEITIHLALGGRIHGVTRDAEGNPLGSMPVWIENLWMWNCSDPVTGAYEFNSVPRDMDVVIGSGGWNWCQNGENSRQPEWHVDTHDLNEATSLNLNAGNSYERLGIDFLLDPIPEPRIYASLTDDVIWFVLYQDAQAHLKIYESAEKIELLYETDIPQDYTTGKGIAFPGEHGVDLVPGLYVEVTDQYGGTRELTLGQISIDTWSIAGNTIGGSVEPGIPVILRLTGGSQYTITDTASGQWSINLTPEGFTLTDQVAGLAFIDHGNSSTRVEHHLPLSGFVYRAGFVSDLTSMNPWLAYGNQYGAGSNSYLLPPRPGLYSLSDGRQDVVPSLAVGLPPALTQEGDFWVAEIPLRTDVFWSDGETLDAADVAFTANTALTMGITEGQWGVWFDPAVLDHVEATGTHTVKFFYTSEIGMQQYQYNTLMAPVLAEHFWAPIVAGAADKHDLSGFNSWYVTEPQAGPYYYVYDPGARYVLIANPHYFRDGVTVTEYENGAYQEAGGDPLDDFTLFGTAEGAITRRFTVGPHNTAVLYQMFGSLGAARDALVAGEIDYIAYPGTLPGDILDSASGSPAVSQVDNIATVFHQLTFNNRRADTDVSAFRRAAAVLIDREALSALVGGAILPEYSYVIEENELWHNAAIPHYGEGLTRQQRLAQAIALLQGAGYTWEGNILPTWNATTQTVTPGGRLLGAGETPVRNLHLVGPSASIDPARAQYAAQIESWLEDIGLEVELDLYDDWGAMIDRIFTQQDFDLYIIGWYIDAFPTHLEDFYASSHADPGENNAGGYSNPAYDTLAAQLLACQTYTECKSIADQLQVILDADMPSVVLGTRDYAELYNDDNVWYPYYDVWGGFISVKNYPGLTALVQQTGDGYLSASLANDRLLAQGFPPGMEVSFRLDAAPGGEVLFGPVTRNMPLDGSPAIVTAAELGIDLQPGMSAVLIVDGETRTLTLTDIGITAFDPATDIVQGFAPASTSVDVRVWVGEAGSMMLDIPVDTDGNWIADFGGVPFDITPDMTALVQQRDADDDATVSEIALPAASFTAIPAAEGSATSFTDTSTDGNDDITGWAWSFGDTQTSTEQSPSHIYEDDGSYEVTLTVTDQTGYTDDATQTVVVSNVAPEVGVGADETITVRHFTRVGSFTDPGADAWTATVDYGEGGGVEPLTLTGKTFTLDHTYVVEMTYTLTVCVSDGDGGSDCDDLALTIAPINDPPAAADDSATTAEDTAVTVNVAANDTDPENNLDPARLSVSIAPQHGAAAKTGLGLITYTPALNFNGEDTFTYEICDTGNLCDTAVVTVTVTAVNDPPTTVNDIASTIEEVTVPIDAASNDGDPENNLDATTVSVVIPGPAHGSAVVNPATGVISYTPALNYSGTDSFSYRVCDTLNACSLGLVTITIIASNDAPLASGDSATTAEDTAVVINVLANDADPENGLDRGSVTLMSGPDHGTITGISTNTGAMTYLPDQDYNGADSFTYRVCDTEAECATAAVNVTVTPVADTPYVNDDFASTNEETLIPIPVRANDTDPDGNLNPANLTITVAAAHGTTSINAPDGIINYTPALNYAGPDSLTYRQCDTTSRCDTAVVSITVLPVNDPPSAAADTALTLEDTAVTIYVLANDQDVDGNLNPASLQVTTPPAQGGAAVNAGAWTITYTPTASLTGADSFVYQVCDTEAVCATATVSITVNAGAAPVPAAPALISPAAGLQTSETAHTFEWQSVFYGVTYEFQIGTSATPGAGLIASKNDPALTFSVSDLAVGTYYWRVRAINKDLKPGAWSTRTLIIDATAPAPPVLSAPANAISVRGTPSYSWAASTGANAYRYQYDDTMGFDEPILYTSDILTTLSFVPPTQTPGTYFWQVQARDAAGNWGVWSAPRQITILPTLPVAPSLIEPLAAQVLSLSNPTLVWTGLADTYQVQLDTVSAFSSPDVDSTQAATSYLLPALANGQYYWRVRGFNAYNEPGPWTAARTFTIDATPPAVPALNTPAANAKTADTTPTLSVTTVTGAATYWFQVSTSEASFDAEIVRQGIVATTAYTVPTAELLPYGVYYWRAQAVDKAGNSSGFSAPRRLLVSFTNLPADGTFTTDTTPTFTWTAVSGATAYRLWVSNDPGFGARLPIPDPLPVSTSYTHSTPITDQYYWKMQVRIGSDNWSDWTPVSAFAVTPPLPIAPVLTAPLTNSTTGDSTPDFTWNTLPELTYEIQIDNVSGFTSLEQTASGLGGSYTADPLLNGLYYWRVRAKNLVGAPGPWSPARTVRIDTTPPAVPTLTTPAANAKTTDTTPALAVGAVSGANRYEFQISTSEADFQANVVRSALVTTTSWTVPAGQDLPYGVFYWRARALDAVDNASEFSAPRMLTISFVSSPANGGYLTDTTPALVWTAVSGALEYEIAVATDEAITEIIFDTLRPVSTSYVSPELTPGGYYWQMRARTGAGWTAWTPVWSFTITPPPPLAPALTSPNNGFTSNATITLMWTAPAGATHYDLLIDNATSFTTPEVTATINSGNTYDVTGLPDGLYYWRVRARNDYDAPGAWSGYRSIRIDTTGPVAPVLVSPANLATIRTRPVLDWNTATSAVSYELAYSVNADLSDPVIVTGVTLTGYTMPLDLPYATYYWRVRGWDAVGNPGVWSVTRQFFYRAPLPAAPALVAPGSGATITVDTVLFDWNSVAGTGLQYEIQVDMSNSFTTPDFFTVIPGTDVSTMLPNGYYYWRVRAINATGDPGAWSAVRSLRVNAPAP